MALSLSLPEDSVLRRHALTEMQRVLGLPPTDSVLQRHHAQLQEMNASTVPQRASASSPPQPAAPRPMAAATAAPAAAAAAGGGFFGWLKRLLGA